MFAQLTFITDSIDQTIFLDSAALEFTGLCGQVVESLQVVVSVDGAAPMTLTAIAPGVPVVVDDPVFEPVCFTDIQLDFAPVAISSVTSPTVVFQITDIVASGTGGSVSGPFAWEVGNPDCTLGDNAPFIVSAQ